MAGGSQGFDGVERRGLMFVLSSPSGAGKTTLSRMLMQKVDGLQMSVSATTRPMRPGEVEGRDYFFVDQMRFDAMVGEGDLLEWATVFGKSYGTPRAPVEQGRQRNALPHRGADQLVADLVRHALQRDDLLDAR